MNFNDFFIYENGEIFWRQRPMSHFKTEKEHKRWNKRHASNKAGCMYYPKKSVEGYLRVVVNSKWLLVHRVVWMMHFSEIPEGKEIDHINGVGNDNRIENLRLVSNLENKKNKPKYKNNKSGITGVNWESKSKKWRARANDNGKRFTVYLGHDLDEAERIMIEHRIILGYHQNHGR